MERPAPAKTANLVRAFREERLMSREELAKRARVSLRTIWSVEAGHECRLGTKRAILRALGIARSRHRAVFPPPLASDEPPAVARDPQEIGPETHRSELA